MSDIVVELKHFSFSMGCREVLRDISISINQGAYLSIIGPNGAGKTTLLKCINRILKGGRGVLNVKGVPINSYSQKELARLISYVPQSDGSSLPFSVLDFVSMGRYPYMKRFFSLGKTDEEIVQESLELTGTKDFSRRILSTLSGGERQKVFIAAALAQRSTLLLLDEPMTFLDPKYQAGIYKILSDINRNLGVSIISVNHDINGAMLSSKEILALKDGSVAFFCRNKDEVNKDMLEGIYEHKFTCINQPDTGVSVFFPE